MNSDNFDSLAPTIGLQCYHNYGKSTSSRRSLAAIRSGNTMRPTLLFAVLAAFAVNADEKSVYVSDWNTVTVTKTVTAPTVAETVPAADRAQINYQTTTLSAVAIDCERSDLSKQSTIILTESVTSSTSALEAAPTTPTPTAAPTTCAGEAPAAEEFTSYWSTAWTFTIEPESTPSAAPSLAISTSAATNTIVANAYQQAVLYNHNIHRRNHSAPNVDWSADLETSARALASKCVYEHDT